MKKLLAVLALAVVMMGTSMDADAARRFGGGISFGKSSSSLFQKAPAAKPAWSQKKSTAQASKATAAKPASPMRGMLMGLAGALGLAALFSALGIGEEAAQMIMMLLVGFMLYYILKMVMAFFLAKKMAASSSNGFQDMRTRFERYEEPQQTVTPQPSVAGARAGSVFEEFSNQSQAQLTIPEGFDVAGFERVSRENFIQMQKAWDRSDLNGIADFCTDEFFTAVTHQLRERGTAEQTSEVINLSAKLLGVVQEGAQWVAVVEFTGAMKIAGEFEEVREHWILVREADDSTGWLLAGIEQTA